MSSVWKNYNVLEVTVRRETQNRKYTTKNPVSRRLQFHSPGNFPFEADSIRYAGKIKKKEGTGRSHSLLDVGSV